MYDYIIILDYHVFILVLWYPLVVHNNVFLMLLLLRMRTERDFPPSVNYLSVPTLFWKAAQGLAVSKAAVRTAPYQ